MTVLAIDPATLTGWCVGGVNSPTFSGVKNLGDGRLVNPGSRFRRLINLMQDQRQAHPEIKLIAFELPIAGSTSSIQKAYSHGYVAIIQLYCSDNKLPYRGVYSSTLKKFMTGHGKADKDEMISAVTARGYEPRDDNEADAIAIMLWATQVIDNSAGLLVE